MPECLLLKPCPVLFDAACRLFRGPCAPQLPGEPWAMWWLLVSTTWWLALFWGMGMGRR